MFKHSLLTSQKTRRPLQMSVNFVYVNTQILWAKCSRWSVILDGTYISTD